MAIIGKKEELGDPRITVIAQADSKKWYQKPNLRFCYLILIPCGLGVEWTSGFDSSMMNSLQAVESWQQYFDYPSSARLGLLNAMYSLGGLMSIPFIPTISAYLGRRRTIIAASLWMCMGAGIQAGSINDHMFMFSRWSLGFGITFAIVNASSLLSESLAKSIICSRKSLYYAEYFC